MIWSVLETRIDRHIPNSLHVSPGPVRAASGTAKDVDVGSSRCNRASDSFNVQVGDGDTCRRGTSRAAVLVVLLDDDAVLGDTREGDVLVGDILDGPGGAVYSLDAHAVCGVLYHVVIDVDVFNSVVRAAANGTDGETVTTGASASSKRNVGAGINC